MRVGTLGGMMRELKYSVVDVFAERALEGNPLAVFHDARGLSDAEMQALARETNLSETTFVLPSEDAEDERKNGVRVRIFTAQEELPFAGHPSLGTGSWLRLNRPEFAGDESVTLKLNVGPIVVRFVDGDGPGVLASMRQNDPVFGEVHDAAQVAQVLGLHEEDVSAEHAPQSVSTGLAFCVVLLNSMDAMARLQIPQREASAWLEMSGSKFFYCIAKTENASADEAFHARMQFYNGEDPATGSAAGCCISWLVKEGLVESGTPVVIEQGIEIHRPSRLVAQAIFENGQVGYVTVSGRTIPVATGSFFLP